MMMRPDLNPLLPDLTAPRTGMILFVGALVIFAIAIAPLIFNGHPRSGPVDFYHLWTAGKMWASLNSPYADSRADLFVQYGLPYIFNTPAPFFYPPHSIVLFGPLGFFSPGVSSFAFALVSTAALIAASVLAADIIRSSGARGSRLSFASAHAIILMAGWNAGPVIFFHNIATIIVYLALLAVLRGAQIKSAILITTGLFFALISPQMSIAVATAMLIRRQTRTAAMTALIGVAIFSLAGLAPGGIMSSLENFFSNIAAYSTFAANSHSNQSGLGFFAAMAFGASLSASVLVAGCVATLVFFSLFSARPEVGEAARSLEFACLAIVSGLFFLPSLNHYYLAVTPAVALLASKKGAVRYLAIAAALLLMRSLDILNALDFLSSFHGRKNAATFDSIAILLLFSAFAWSWISSRTVSLGIFRASRLRRHLTWERRANNANQTGLR